MLWYLYYITLGRVWIYISKNRGASNTNVKANNFYKPRIHTDIFAYTAIDDWNALPNNIKLIKSEDKFKESLKKSLLAASLPMHYGEITKGL